ncbi:MAG: hypothetical protein PGN29_08575 [Gordonia paraffinivorans]
MPDGMRVDVAAVVELAAVQRAIGADLAAVDARSVGLGAGELAGSMTAPALARGVDAIAQALGRVAERVEELGRRTAWGARALTEADAAAADGLRRGGG